MSTTAKPRHPLIRFFTIETELEQRNYGLDVMRAIGMIMVLTGHSLHFFETYFPKIFRLSHFYINGIELFFSLSGFLIGNMLIRNMIRKNDFSARALFEFCRRRWYKTLPVYYLALGIIYLAGVFVTGYHHDFSWKHLFFLQNLYTAESWFFPVSYSLAIEEWFYILFPLVFLALVYLFRNRKHALTAMVLTCVVFITTALVLRSYVYFAHHPNWDAVMRRGLLMRLDCSVYGVLLAVLWNKYRDRLLRNAMLLLAAGLLLHAVTMYFRINRPDGFIYYVVYFTTIPVSFVLFIPWFYKLKRPGKFLFRFFTSLSLLSFSIYLFHLSPLEELFIRVAGNADLVRSCGVFAVYLLTVMLVAATWYKYVETPFTNMRERK